MTPCLPLPGRNSALPIPAPCGGSRRDGSSSRLRRPCPTSLFVSSARVSSRRHGTRQHRPWASSARGGRRCVRPSLAYARVCSRPRLPWRKGVPVPRARHRRPAPCPLREPSVARHSPLSSPCRVDAPPWSDPAGHIGRNDASTWLTCGVMGALSRPPASCRAPPEGFATIHSLLPSLPPPL